MKERIDGAVFFDIDEVSDKSSQFPHMLPSSEQFSSQVGQVRGRKEGKERERKRERERGRERERERNKREREGEKRERGRERERERES